MNEPRVSSAPSAHRLYTRRFFTLFAAVMLFMTCTSLQFHFGQYIGHLGHGVDVLGRILGVSMVGTLLIRLHIGRWIDRFGVRSTWVVATLIASASIGTMQYATSPYVIAGLRSLGMMASAAVMTGGAVFAAQIAPPERRAESIGSMGLAGFLGIIVGPTLGDFIFADATDSMVPYHVFFTLSATCSFLSGVVALSVPADDLTPVDRETHALSNSSETRSSQLRIIREHWPGMILLVGLTFSMVFTFQSSFLERLAEFRGFKDIKLFFLCYSPSAIVLRIIFRRLPERFGRTRTLLLGSSLMIAGLFCLAGTDSQLGLVLPGLVMGAGHCFIFPSMVDLAAGALPAAHRGTGTTLILGAGDVGMLIGYTGVGEVIDAFGFTVALASLATALLVTATVFAMTQWPHVVQRRTDVPAIRV